MAITGLELNSTRLYESKYDPDKGTPEASKFHIGTLDSRVYGHLKDKATTMRLDVRNPNDEVDTALNMQEVNFQTVQFGLRDWSNVKDSKGEEIPFETEGRRLGGASYKILKADILKLLPAAVIEELAAEISKVNDLTEEQAKN